VDQSRELTVYIVEDSAVVRQRLEETIDEIPQARILGHAETAADALTALNEVTPRVLIVDIQLREGSGFNVLKSMRARNINWPPLVIVVTNYPREDYREISRKFGANYFLDKASEFDQVREAMLKMLESA
jgi:two-component system OmpR family response regulator